jgi:predicted ATP-grasp superfamily ATP-dependent carboligase
MRVPGMTAAALVIGLCSHGLSVARGLHAAGVAVYALEKNFYLPGAATNAVRHMFAVDDFSEEVLIARLLALRAELAQYDQVVLFPTNDNHVRIIGSAFARLAAAYRLSWSDCISQVLRLQKKSELETVAVERGLHYPRSAVIDQPAAAPAALAGFGYPVILKPVQPLSSFKTILADTPEQLMAALDGNRQDLPILVQEYIAGGDETLYFGALVLDRGRVVQAMVGRKLASYPPARGQTTVAEVVSEPEVIALTEQFFDSFALSGPVSLELKRGPDGRFWVIEPTVGRTDFWSELCIAAGFNQPFQEYQLALGQVPAMTPMRTDLVWYDAEKEVLCFWQAAWRQRTLQPYGKRAAFTFWRWGDLAPFWRASGNAVQRQFRKFA